LVVDTENMSFEALSNESSALSGGAGIQSAQFVSSKGAQVLITGNCGPNAVQALSAAGVKVILGQSGTVREATERFNRGEHCRKAIPMPGVRQINANEYSFVYL
jgi:predicted Fe-Mo cluster-binding NifX family protein